MALFNFVPIADWINQGWALVGSGVQALFQALNNADDAKYCQCPSSKGSGVIRFPIDTTDVPEGAVVISVTIRARIGPGAGSPLAGIARSVTFALSADDDTARYMTRTIYPLGSIGDYVVATYTRDALGLTWDVHRLNHILCKFFTYGGVFDLIRLYRLYCVVNYRVRPSLQITAPTGTVETPSPVVSWVYSQTDGDPMKRIEYKIFTQGERSKVSFNPETSTPIFVDSLDGEASSVTLPTSLNSNTYWVYMRAESSFGAKSKWEGRQFTVAGPSPGTPGVPDTTGTVDPGVGVIQVVPDSEEGAAAITLQDTSNMLSAQQADAENPGEAGQMSGVTGTVLRSTLQAYPGGTASWRVVSTSGATTTALTDWIELTPGTKVTATGQVLANSTTRSCVAKLVFYDDVFAQISTVSGTGVTNSASTWRGISVTADVPAGAAYAKIAYDFVSTANTEVHYLDQLSLSYGEGTDWSDGGQMSRNLLSDWYASPGGTAQPGEAWVGDAAVTIDTTTATGTGATGTTMNRLNYDGTSPSIAYRAAGTAFVSATSGNNFTLNKPTGVVADDLMVAFLTASTAAGNLTPPAGWTIADTVRMSDTGADNQTIWVLKRTAGGSEPASWTDGFLSENYGRRSAIVVAYSGAADAGQQFLAMSQAKNANNTPMWATTAAVNNTDPNAWRLMAFSVDDNAAPGTLTANKLQPSVVPDIAYVGKASAWKYAGGNNVNYTINKPSGVISGDLMLASLFVVGVNTISAPAGWTIVWQGTYNSGNAQVTGCVLRRTATGSEPSSWSGTMSGSANQGKVSQCVAYRNVDTSNPFIANSGNTAGSGSSGSTSTIANTDARAWRVMAFGAGHGGSDTNLTFTSSEVSERADDRSVYTSGSWPFQSFQTAALAMYDSNGPVATGNHQRTATASTQYVARYGWLGLLRPLSTPPSPIADETARQVANVGASNPYMSLRVFDSNGVVPTGNQAITGVWAPGSGSDMNNMAGWQGLIIPAAPQVSGYGVARMSSPVDIANINPRVLALARRKVAVTAAFLGSKTGTPFLTVNFYRANVLLRSDVSEGVGYNTTVWTKSAAVFNIPEGTTRMGVEISSSELEINDKVYWDRVSLSLGDSIAYRPGTSRTTHPVWSRPEIEFADDAGAGYDTFRQLPGSLANAGSFDSRTGYAAFTDHTIIPLTNRKYRAKTVAYGLAGDMFVSDFGPESSEFSIEAVNWWLKDIADPTRNLQLKVKWEDVSVSTTNTATVFQPLGADLPVVLSEGYKGDSFSVNMRPVNHEGWAQLREMLLSGRTLFLQSDIDHAWFVRPVGDLNSVILATQQRRSNPLREISVGFVQVEAEL